MGYVAASIPHFVAVEMIEGLVSTIQIWTTAAVMWIEMVINVSVKVTRLVEARAGTDEDTAIESLGPVV